MSDAELALNSAAREHAWKYFEIHAGQRMSIFNFFLVLSGLVLAGIAGCLSQGRAFRLEEAVLGAALSVVSFVFWKLDQRTSFLIKLAEDALAELESHMPVCAQLFIGEVAATARAKQERAVWTYGFSFRVVFWLTGTVGIASIVLAFRG